MNIEFPYEQPFPEDIATLEEIGRNCRRLAAAVLIKAARDAQAEDPALAGPARRWLAREGITWAEMLDLRPELVIGWLAGLPALSWEQLALPW